MAMTTTTKLPSYINTEPKKLLIGGQWIPAQSEKTFDSFNPSTGEVICSVGRR